MRVLIPPLDDEPWPTLGPEICDWLEAKLCHGPGDVLGEPIELTNEERLFLYRVYEVFPKGHRRAGRRRFSRAIYSRRKGARKTEFAAWIAIAESYPSAPVRCDGWRKDGGVWVPVGRGVTDPYIPMVSYTREQLEDLAYNTVYEILAHTDLGDDYDLTLEQISLRIGPGKIQARASAPDARDGARTTFQHFDETHRMDKPRLVSAHQTMLRNASKRKQADPWTLETTTAYAPGEGSVAEGSHRHAERIALGEISDPALFFDHRQATETHNLQTKKGRRAALAEASGDAIAWTDIDKIIGEWDDPQLGEPGWRRYWGNQPWNVTSPWLPTGTWAACAEPNREPPDPGTPIVVGFWGEASRITAGMVGATPDGHLFTIAAWDHTDTPTRVSPADLELAKNRAVETWRVVEIVSSVQAGSGWISEVQDWAQDGLPVTEIPVNSTARMGPACTRFRTDAENGRLTHDGHPILTRHIAAATPATSIYGEFIRPGPKGSISTARAAVLAYERAAAQTWEDDVVADDIVAGVIDLADAKPKEGA